MDLRTFRKVPYRYGALFSLLLFDIGFLIVAPAEGWSRMVQAVLIAATLLLALRTSEASPRVVRIAMIGAALTLATGLTVSATGAGRLEGIVYFLDAVLLLVAIVAVLRAVAMASQIDGKMVLGALSAYLMIGLAFAFTYLGVALASSAPFFAQSGPHTPGDYVYFSYITISTTGYGDLSPSGNLPRMLAVVEALSGQIFLVTAVASIVSLWRPRRRDPAP